MLVLAIQPIDVVYPVPYQHTISGSLHAVLRLPTLFPSRPGGPSGLIGTCALGAKSRLGWLVQYMKAEMSGGGQCRENVQRSRVSNRSFDAINIDGLASVKVIDWQIAVGQAVKEVPSVDVLASYFLSYTYRE